MRGSYYQKRYVEDPPIARAVRRQTPQTEGKMQAVLEEKASKRRRMANRRERPKDSRIPTVMTGNRKLG